MNQILLAERRAIARALPRLTFFVIITALAYSALIATELGYGSDELRLFSAITALVFASLIVNTAVCLIDHVRYADKHRMEHARRLSYENERC